ncbi:MAG: asparaginase [Rhodospirillales bacterium]|nr:asparaginase [Alphaproteobacteria bacterium]MBL6948456.1 asparaginase [Rhodospirillales bacterium]
MTLNNPLIPPLTVEVTRGAMVESRHRGDCVVIDRTGKVVRGWGGIDRLIYPRSAIKPLQALPLIETGAADAFDISEAELALAAASHSSTPDHVNAIAAWLERLGLSESDLECGGHDPMHRDSDKALIRSGVVPGPLYNNCSGKHAGFLNTARHMGEETKGYLGPDHPVQQRLAAVMEEMGATDLSETPRGVDGCGIPVYGMALRAMALAMARMADPQDLEPARADAAKRIYKAMTSHPNMVGGPGRFDTVAMTAGKGAFVVKAGAEGVYAGIVPGLGLGVALKIDDGTKRAAEVAMAGVLDLLGVLDIEAKAGMQDFLTAPVLNSAGLRVGDIRMADGWAEG